MPAIGKKAEAESFGKSPRGDKSPRWTHGFNSGVRARITWTELLLVGRRQS
jgi:hypothetical protein